jgi:hypothetical protein
MVTGQSAFVVIQRPASSIVLDDALDHIVPATGGMTAGSAGGLVAVGVSPASYWGGGRRHGRRHRGDRRLLAQLAPGGRQPRSGALFVCVIGLFAYYSLVVDRTAIHAGDRVFYLSHYLYWILTQPMLFVAVALAALPPLSNPGDRRLRASLFGGLVGAAVAWTSAGLFQAWAQSEGERWAWFGLAVAGLAAVVWQLWFPVLHQGQIKGGEHLRDYGLMAGLLTALSVRVT